MKHGILGKRFWKNTVFLMLLVHPKNCICRFSFFLLLFLFFPVMYFSPQGLFEGYSLFPTQFQPIAIIF